MLKSHELFNKVIELNLLSDSVGYLQIGQKFNCIAQFNSLMNLQQSIFYTALPVKLFLYASTSSHHCCVLTFTHGSCASPVTAHSTLYYTSLCFITPQHISLSTREGCRRLMVESVAQFILSICGR